MDSTFVRRRVALRVLSAGIGGLLLGAAAAHADTASWPERTVTILVPYAPGGGTDSLARLMAAELGNILHQPVIVENKPGGRGIIAYQALLRNANDGGYTFLLDNSSFAVQPLYKEMPFDPKTAFSPVARLTISPTVLIVSKNVPAQNLKDFVTYAKSNPGKVAFASYGVGSSSHLNGELLNTLAATRMLHVPYKGSGPALTDLVGGQVQAMFCDPLSAKPLVDAGKVRALAISGYERWKAYPDTPTYRELGYDQMSAPGWWGVVTSSKTPRDVTEKMSAALQKVVASDAVKARIRDLGAEVSPMGTVEFTAFVKGDTNRWANVVKVGNIDLASGG